MRVRVIASRISAMIADRRSKAPSTGTSVGDSRRRRASSLRASTMSETPLITRSSSSTDRRMVRGAAILPCASATVAATGAAGAFGARRKRLDQRAVVAARHVLAGVDRRDHLADPVDDREHRADQRAIGLAAAGADVGQRILGGVAQRLEPREFEEAAIAFDGVDEAENGIEARAVVGLGLPGDDFAAQGLEHLPAFGHEIGDQIVHRRLRPPRCSRTLMPGEELMPRYP